MRLRFEDWIYDGDVRQLSRGETPIRLTPKAFELLGALLESRPKALSKSAIHDRVWPDTFVSEATLASVVSELRAALGDDSKAPRFVRTVHGHGYAFSGAAVEEPAAPPRTISRYRRLSLGPAVALLAVGLGIIGAGALAWKALRGPASPAASPSLAVLPLRDLSNEPEQAYVVDGLTEALMTSLARVGGLRVVARTSVMRYKDGTRPIPEIAKELGVDLLVDGSALRNGGRVRITARLIDAPRDRQLWTRTYEGPVEESAQLPDRIARDVAEAARLKLTAQQQARLSAARPVDPDAYNAYLKGRYQLARDSLEANRKAVELFQESLGRDPTYAPAYAHLANAYLTLGSVWAGEPPRPMRALAAAAAQKALELDPDLADGHTHLGNTRLREWDFAGAQRDFLRATELDPSSADAHSGYSYYLIVQNRMEEAVKEARTAETLDPLDVRTRRGVGYALFHARRYDEAIAHYQGLVATEPRDVFTRWFLAWSYSARGRHEEAVAELQRAVELSDRGPALVGALAGVLARAGRASEARALLAEIHEVSRRRYVSPGAFIPPLVALGEHDQAFEWLERGFQDRINLMIFINSVEALDPLRHDPRFRDLVERIGLPLPEKP